MTAITPTVGSLQGIGAFKSGIQIGGTTVTTGSGSPSAAMTALRIGDLYVDYTNGALYIATGTGTGSWEVAPTESGTNAFSGTNTFTGTLNVNITPTITGTQGTIATGASPLSYKVATLGGTGATPVHLWTIYGAPSAVGPTPEVAGDLLVDTKNGKIYIASAATAYTDWKLVTSA